TPSRSSACSGTSSTSCGSWSSPSFTCSDAEIPIMAEKSKKSSGEKAPEKKQATEKAAHDDHEEHGSGHDGGSRPQTPGHDGGHAGHGAGAAHAAHQPNIREYMVIFAVLAVLTVIEIAVANPAIDQTLKGIALVSLALTKAAIVGLYYMHLK